MGNELTPREQLPVRSYSFDQIKRMADSFAKSGLFGIKDADAALALMLVAEAEGRSPALVMKDFDVIQGRPAKKAEAMLRDFQASGGRVEWKELSDNRACAVFTHPLAPAPLEVDWDVERAKRAGLLEKSGGMYDKYRRAMLRSRCISEGVRSTAPQATGQFYTPEEVRAIEVEVAAQSVTAAVAEATKEPLPKDEFDALVAALDVKTRPELADAFNAGWKVIKEHGNEAQIKAFRSWRDDMLSVIEGAEIG